MDAGSVARAVGCGLVLLLAACGTTTPPPVARPPLAEAAAEEPGRTSRRVVTLAFAGDVHFQIQLAALLQRPGAGLGPLDRILGDADVTMVNLESAVTERGSPEAKERERPADRYWFRTPARALDLLAASGVDVVSVANNHGADYGPVGLRDTIRAADDAPLAVLGAGRDRRAALAPHRVTVRGTRLAFLAADASFREGSSSVWGAGPRSAGLAAARGPRPAALLRAVRRADRTSDAVVVYLHWGQDGRSCPTTRQRVTADALAAAGADVVVGSHAHVPLGSGWLPGGSYVSYGLGNTVWYHGREPDSGVLRLRLEDGEVVRDRWLPARIPLVGGAARPLRGPARQRAVASWEDLRGCARLADARGSAVTTTPYRASVRTIGPRLRRRMQDSHPGGCPTPWRELRHLRLGYVGFDGLAHRGEMVVAAAHADDVVDVFRTLYDARWPIRRMRLVDDYGADDDRSMAADNTSGFNCRTVAGTGRWSDHAYGSAIDLNPVENPYLRGDTVAPRAGRRYAAIDRSAGARVPRGVIRADDVVVEAFAAIGWEWGGTWADPDYQHFSAPPQS